MTSEHHKKKRFHQRGLFDNEMPSKGRPGPTYAVIYCDGASSGNPGRAGIGVVIHPADKEYQVTDAETHRISEYIGIATNNTAEYSALIRGLEEAKSLGILNIKVFLDSELIVRQINGVYRVRNKNLIPLFTKVKKLLEDFDAFTITHVRRELNTEADALARKAVKNSGN